MKMITPGLLRRDDGKVKFWLQQAKTRTNAKELGSPSFPSNAEFISRGLKPHSRRSPKTNLVAENSRKFNTEVILPGRLWWIVEGAFASFPVAPVCTQRTCSQFMSCAQTTLTKTNATAASAAQLSISPLACRLGMLQGREGNTPTTFHQNLKGD